MFFLSFFQHSNIIFILIKRWSGFTHHHSHFSNGMNYYCHLFITKSILYFNSSCFASLCNIKFLYICINHSLSLLRNKKKLIHLKNHQLSLTCGFLISFLVYLATGVSEKYTFAQIHQNIYHPQLNKIINKIIQATLSKINTSTILD